jgi:hypothetical protein
LGDSGGLTTNVTATTRDPSVGQVFQIDLVQNALPDLFVGQEDAPGCAYRPVGSVILYATDGLR